MSCLKDKTGQERRRNIIKPNGSRNQLWKKKTNLPSWLNKLRKLRWIGWHLTGLPTMFLGVAPPIELQTKWLQQLINSDTWHWHITRTPDKSSLYKTHKVMGTPFLMMHEKFTDIWCKLSIKLAGCGWSNFQCKLSGLGWTFASNSPRWAETLSINFNQPG